jgi:hypothetical protein
MTNFAHLIEMWCEDYQKANWILRHYQNCRAMQKPRPDSLDNSNWHSFHDRESDPPRENGKAHSPVFISKNPTVSMMLEICVIVAPPGRCPVSRYSISIIGEHDDVFVVWIVNQFFCRLSSPCLDVGYILPSNNKLCLCDRNFWIDNRLIKVILHGKNVMKDMIVEGVTESCAVTLGHNF